MAEDDARGDFRESVIAFDVGFGQVGRERNVEAEFALIDEFENGVGEDRFTEGSGFEDSFVGDGFFGSCVLDTETAQPSRLAMAKYRDSEAWNVGLTHEVGDVFLQLNDGGIGCGV